MELNIIKNHLSNTLNTEVCNILVLNVIAQKKCDFIYIDCIVKNSLNNNNILKIPSDSFK